MLTTRVLTRTPPAESVAVESRRPWVIESAVASDRRAQAAQVSLSTVVDTNRTRLGPGSMSPFWSILRQFVRATLADAQRR